MNAHVLVELSGWIGAVSILAAYALLSTGRIGSRSTPYQVLNIVGGATLVVNTAWNHAYPGAALNFVWVVIGGFALYKARSERTSVPEADDLSIPDLSP